MSHPLQSALLVLAGLVAGLVGSAGGITSLVSYPALLALGLPALDATVANNVALVACWPGSALASRPELEGRAGWVARWCAVAAVAGGAGAVLLLVTPSDAFDRIVPWLVLAGALALLLEPRMTAWRERRDRRATAAALVLPVLAVSLYNGYFGAGAGVMTLTLMLVLVDRRLATANALKNMLIGASSVASATVLVLSTAVAWSSVAALAVGMAAGANLGPRIARRMPTRVLRLLIVALGVALAVRLWLS
ncbi:sulfite exporter TauE/SafE family protein [Solirubrobacter phytolaccae]|uniref:Probable membrane transporter protein n=1 Tax=Solirubrobacter phytolaccae TaxID=1404360 RepID=A0A9X3N506_9ACTN|nr:sulfite exporter TauE/SafE family protein [Solirubrobacter phytolaccae]MDA0179759.1 sulfite exporter TauE/SafE family protein [Solirubrobacter phytolaccae]